MNVQNIYSTGEAAVLGTQYISGSLWGTADGVLGAADYWHYLLDKGSLIGMSSGELHGSSAAGAINNLIIPTSNIGAILTINGSSDFSFCLGHAPTVTGSGTAITPFNFNLTKLPGALGATVYYGATLTNTGTTRYRKYIPSGLGRFGGGQAIGGGEWALTAGTAYVVQILPHAIGTFNMAAEWYIKT